MGPTAAGQVIYGRGGILLPAPATGDEKPGIQAIENTTPDVLAGRWVDALSGLLLVGLWRLERRNSRAGLT